MGRGLNKQQPFTVTWKRSKAGTVTVITHTGTNFRTLAISGKGKYPKGFPNSTVLFSYLRAVSKQFLSQFPDLFSQNYDTSIVSYSLPVRGKGNFTYDFQYTMNGGPDTEAAIKQVLSQVGTLNTEVSACTIQAPEQSYDP